MPESVEALRVHARRSKLREALQGQGFERTGHTQASDPDEEGITLYTERWERPDALIVLEWTK